MAKISKIARNERQIRESKKHLELRRELRRKVKDMNLSEEERFDAQMRLQKLPRKTSEIRVRNRCQVTGRPRGYLRAFKMSRIAFRELASRGMIPGVTKSSW